MKHPFRKLTPREQIDLVAKYRALFSQGRDDNEILDDLNLNKEDLVEIRRRFLQHEMQRFEGRTPQEHFAEFSARQSEVARRLAEVAEEKNTPASTKVAALKEASRIQQEIYKSGQAIGVIPKVAQRIEVVGGVNLDNASDADLQKMIRDQVVELEKLRGIEDGSIPLSVVKPDKKGVTRSKALVEPPPPPDVDEDDEDDF